MKYKLDEPYPSLDNLGVHVKHGHILLSNLGGLHSEINTFSLFFYNSIILEKRWPSLSHVMKEICLVEFEHLEIFARMCYQLGVDPRLWDCQNDLLEYWSPGYNIYPRHIDTMLSNAILQKQNTMTIYQYQISCIDDPIIQDVLKHIIEEEQMHVHILETYLKKYHQKKKDRQ